MTARKKATRKKSTRKKAPRKKTPRKKTPRKPQAKRPSRPGSVKAARVAGARSKPKIKWDLENVKLLASRANTQEDAAVLLGVARSTFTEAIANDEEFAKAWNGGLAGARDKLRANQFASADGGNVTMQIWLGKVLLGQRETVQVGNPDGSNFEDMGSALARKLGAFIQSKAQAAGAEAETG